MLNQINKLIFYGGVGATTGANIMLVLGDKKILIDCGILQGTRDAYLRNHSDFAYAPDEVDYLLLTHAHMDHIGRVPKLVKAGFKGKIISTPATKELALPMFEDALKLMQIREDHEPLYDQKDVENTFKLWNDFEYGKSIDLGGRVSAEFLNAGHILGSAIINIEITPPSPLLQQEGEPNKTMKISFTGDLGNSPSPLLPDNEVPKGVDYLVMESVYGDRNHASKEDRRAKLKQIIMDTQKNGSTVIIPVFSIERTQVLLYEINNMIEDKEISKLPVFLDSPLGSKVTAIYQKYKNEFKTKVKDEIRTGDDIFDFPGLKIIADKSESALIREQAGAKIILAGSGMSEGGRVLGHEAHYLGDPNAVVAFVGFQALGSVGRSLLDGAKEVWIDEDGDQKTKKKLIKVRAKIQNVPGYSSHKDSEHLLEFVEKITSPPTPLLEAGEESRDTRLKKVFVIMGEPRSSLFLSQRIKDYLGIEAVYPEEGKEYELN